jgi:cardiolipin synthase A/B
MPLQRKDRWQDIDTLLLLESGEEYFESLEAAFQSAQRSIDLEVYIFTSDEQTKEISNLLCSAAQRGVRVRVIVDWIGSSPFVFEKEMHDSGVELKYYNPSFFGQFGFSRTHRKIVVIDEQTVYLGSANICSDHLDHLGVVIQGKRWDLVVRATGPIVAQIQLAFLWQWSRLSEQGMYPRNILKRLFDFELPWPRKHLMGVRESSQASVAFIARDNFHHRRDIEKAYLKAIGQSREEVWLTTPYFMPGMRFRNALVKAAQRGVAVHILLGVGEFKILNWSVPALYGQLLASGASIYEYKKGVLHAKTMVVDGRWMTLGSSNCDRLSFLLNHESNLMIVNHELVIKVRERIRFQIELHAERVDSSAYVKRPIWIKIMNWLIYGILKMVMSILVIGAVDRSALKQ